MGDNSVLMVFGLHGVTEGGNHGGTSDDEIHSMLFAYSNCRPFSDIRKNEETNL